RLLEGLGKSSGKLLSQKSAFEAGLLKTGEGTTFSSGAGLKTNVYIGKGETGFGTAASYALAPASLTSYNVSLFSDQELASEIDRHNKVLQLEQILSLMNPTIVGSGRGVTMAQIKEAAINAGLDVSDPGYARMFGLQTSLQLKDMLSKLLKEQQARKTWDVNDPRRQGGQVNPDNYPILLEFDLTGLTVTEDFGGKQREAKGDYRLAGEATVSDEIDLTSGRLKVVYCPEQFIGRTDTKLKAVFGDTHGVTIRALESIRGAITKDSKADKTISATYGQLEKQQKSLDVKMKAHSDLASGLSIPTEFVGKGGQKFEQRRTAGGGSGYVATDLSKSMSANPAFEAAALAFEQRLGAYAFAHTKANAAAKSIADKIVAYLDERKRLVETLETGTQEAFSGADAYGKVGELNKRIAGAVGKNIDDIKAVFTSGNLRERMTHTYNFATRVLHADLELNDQQDTVKQILSTVDIDEDEARGVKEIPVDDVMGQRDETRASSGRGTFGESTVKSLADLGLGLSAREKTHLSANKDTAKVGWNEGARMWFMNEANEWVQAQRELSIPLMAGPSSHTNTIMRTAKALKVGNLDHVRLALIGHLVPIRAHSLVEILVAAKPFGVPFTKGVEMYKKIDPLPESELRANVAENDKFPGET
ncbi:MAG: hypothetical protein ACE5FI_10445, partial [Anaerolineales bacterium]